MGGSTGCSVSLISALTFATPEESVCFFALAKRAANFNIIVLGFVEQGPLNKPLLNPPTKDEPVTWEGMDLVCIVPETYNQSGSRQLYTAVQRKTMRAAEMAAQKSNSSASQLQRISSSEPRDSKLDEYDMPATETTEEMKKKSRSSASNKHPGVTLDPEDDDALNTRVAELVRSVACLDLQEIQRQRLGQVLERLRELVLAGGRLDKVPTVP